MKEIFEKIQDKRCLFQRFVTSIAASYKLQNNDKKKYIGHIIPAGRPV